MLSRPNHVILPYRGGTEAFLYQVSHPLPALVGGGGVGGCEEAVQTDDMLYPKR